MALLFPSQIAGCFGVWVRNQGSLDPPGLQEKSREGDEAAKVATNKSFAYIDVRTFRHEQIIRVNRGQKYFPLRGKIFSRGPSLYAMI